MADPLLTSHFFSSLKTLDSKASNFVLYLSTFWIAVFNCLDLVVLSFLANLILSSRSVSFFSNFLTALNWALYAKNFIYSDEILGWRLKSASVYCFITEWHFRAVQNITIVHCRWFFICNITNEKSSTMYYSNILDRSEMPFRDEAVYRRWFQAPS